MVVDIITFRHDSQLLGGLPHMRTPATQWASDTFLSAVYGGRPLDDEELELFRRCTGRQTARIGGYAEAVLVTGRQAGKSQVAGDVVAFEAATAPRDGSAEGTYALLVAQDQRGAQRAVFRYASAPFDRVPMLERTVIARTADTLALDNGVTIAAYPCRPAAIRGIRARVAVVDELAYFRSSDGNPADTEVLRAVRPTLATTGGKLIILSSPYSQTGALWDLHRQHYGRDESSTLVWVASAPTMNPTLPADYLERMRTDDPEAYRSEVLGEFRSGIASFIADPDALDACVTDRRELLPAPGVEYKAFADISGGQRDASVLAVAHAEGQRAVVDCVRAWPAPHNPEAIIADAAALALSYRCRHVTGDRYAGQFPAQAFMRHGVGYRISDLDRSSLYVELLPKILAGPGALELPNDAALMRELRGLERRRGFAGKDRIDHRPGSHDDRANAVAGVVYLVAGRRRVSAGTIRVVGF